MKLLIIIALLYTTNAAAQSKPLSIGDTLPPHIQIILQNNLHPSSNQHNLSRTRFGINKLPNHQIIIIDFWATWCGSCLKKLPLLDSALQKHAGLQVLLVNSKATTDTPEKIAAFFASRKNPAGKQYQFPQVNNDTLWRSLFPHTALPHYVWIQNNKVIAITGTAEITTENIAAALNGEQLNLPLKDDIEKRKKLKSSASPTKASATVGNPIHHSPLTIHH